MFKIKTMNTISGQGIGVLEKRGCEVGAAVENPDGLLIRSADLHGYDFGENLLGIARAGAGYNNIPTEECAEHGIVVFNSPGANAEAVKEQEIFWISILWYSLHFFFYFNQHFCGYFI